MNRAKQYLNKLVNKIITETLKDKAKEVAEKIQMGKLNPPPAEFDYVAEGETLGRNLGSCFSFGKSFFLTIIVPELEYFIIECFY